MFSLNSKLAHYSHFLTCDSELKNAEAGGTLACHSSVVFECMFFLVTSSTEPDLGWFCTSLLSMSSMNLSSDLLVTWIFLFFYNTLGGWVSGDPYHSTQVIFWRLAACILAHYCGLYVYSYTFSLIWVYFTCLILISSIQIYLSFATFLPNLDFFPFFKLLALFSLCSS